MVTKARQLAEFIANADVDSDEIATGAVSASKLADTLDLSSKTIVMPDVAAFNITSGDRVGIKNSGTDISGTSLDDLVVGAGTTLAGMVLDGGASNDTAYGFANAGTKVGRIQYINSSNNMVFQTNNANRMVIDGSGDVGIGTTSPDYLMHLYKGGSTLLKLQSTTATSLVNFINSGGSATIVSQNNILNLQTDNTTRMHLDASGNVGIGTTSPDIYSFGGRILGINGGTSYTNLVLAGDLNSGIAFGTSSGRLGQISMDSTNGLVFYSQGTGNGHTMTLDRSGNVGIGTNNPSDNLEIDIAASNTGITLTDNGDGFFPQISYNSNRPSAGQSLGKFSSYWNGTEVARIEFAAGTDATNKDDGAILFNTKISGASLTTKVKIDTNGNVGIGRTDPIDKLNVHYGSTETYNTTLTKGTNTQGLWVTNANNSDNMAGIHLATGGGTHFSSIVGARTDNASHWGTHLAFYTHDHSVSNLNTAAEKMRITGDGNVGIGTTNPADKLDIQGADNGITIRSSTSNRPKLSLINGSSTMLTLSANGSYAAIGGPAGLNDYMLFHPNSGNRVIASGGAINLHNANTAGWVLNGNGNLGQANFSTNNNRPLILHRYNGTGQIAEFGYSQSTVGSIDVTASGTTYNTTSDRRLKDNITTITDGKEKILAMNPVTHTWKADPDAPQVHGFIAQEMQEVAPEAVSGDAESEDMMSMDYGRITPVIVAALKDALQEIDKLKEKIKELEAK